MKNKRIAFAVISSILLASSSALASLPQSATGEVTSGSHTEIQAQVQIQTPNQTPVDGATSAPIQTASFAESCSDPDYSWWEYSGIEALTCLLSGQW